MKKYGAPFALLVWMLCLAACSGKKTVRENGVYFWKTTYHLQPEEMVFIAEHHIRKLYLRLFDVDIDEKRGGVIPIGRVEFADTLLPNLEYIPVVYITNKALVSCRSTAIDTLAENIFKQVGYICLHSNLQYRELQIDCDWTDATRDKYFALLGRLKKLLGGKALSATIRLHQVKYSARTGIPPVDKGVLMFYNMDKVDAVKTRNSILNTPLGLSYLTSKKYPLPLDLALPVFEWTLQFRDNQLLAIHSGLHAPALADKGRYQPVGPGYYRVVNGHFTLGSYLRHNDLLRFESVTPADLEQAVAALGKLDLTFNNVLLFHLDTTHIHRYEKSCIDKVFAFDF
jgi:hypothetical protein